MKSIKHTAKKIITVSALASAVAFASLSFAQAEGQAKHCKVQGPDRLFSALSVQDSQKEGFNSIMQAQHDQRKALHEQYNDIRTQERAAMKTLHASTLESLKTVLTEQQLENFKAITLHNRPAKKGDKHMKGPQMAKHQKGSRKDAHKEQGKKASEHMITTLELSDGKADAFKDIMKAQDEQRKVIREQYKETHQAERQAMKALFENTLVQLESVLTEQQIDNLKAIRKHNRRA